MSRAFTKEDDAGDDIPERPIPSGPNYVTPRGLELLEQALKDLLAKRQGLTRENDAAKFIDRDLRYLEARIQSATVVPPGHGFEARFGAIVTIEGPDGSRRTFQIVGEDEARTDEKKFLPWSAPLVMELLGSRAGETFTWEGPDGAISYKLITVEYS